jgi:hypothetical protein
MRKKPLDLERLKELVGEPAAAAGEDDFVHEIAPVRSPKSLEKLTAAAVAAIEADVGPRRKYSPSVRPPALQVNRKRTSYYLLVLVTLVATIAWYRALHRPPPVPSDPIALVAVLSPAAAASVALAPEWSVTRGLSDSLSERGRAVRIGSLLVEFERAAERRDSTAQRWADAIAALLTDQPDGVEVAAIFASGGDAARTPDTRHKLAPLVRTAPMAVGGWLQAARVASAAGDVGFFASAKSRQSLAALLAMPGVSAEVQAARNRLQELLSRRGRPAFAVVGDALQLIQSELAN